MVSGIITGAVLIFICWVLLTSLFYESRGAVVAIYCFFYAIGFVFFYEFIFYPKNSIEESLFAAITVLGFMFVSPLYLIFGVPTLILLKSGRKGIGWMDDVQGGRIVEDIPTSSIHTGAMGSFVEIKGTLVAFKHQLSGNFDHSPQWWFTRDAFFVDDKSGSYALVDPAGAEMVLSGKGLKLGTDVYVRGFAEAGRDYQARPGLLGWGVYFLQMVSKIFQYISRATAKFIIKIAADRVGGSYPDDLRRGDTLRQEEETLSPEMQSTTYPEMLGKTNMIFRRGANHRLIISNRSEKGLTGYLRRRSMGRMLQGVLYLIVTFLVFSSILSSCEKHCTIHPKGFSVDCVFKGSMFGK